MNTVIQFEGKSPCVCGQPASKWCSGCKFQRYCSRECQKFDWPQHKKISHLNPDSKTRDLIKSFARGVQTGTSKNKSLDQLTRAEKQRMLARISGAEQNIDIMKHIISHIRSNWPHIITDFLEVSHKMNGDSFFLYYMTIPYGDKVYDTNLVKAPYWTLALFSVRPYPNTIYLNLSDHTDGICLRSYELNNGTYICDPNHILYNGDKVEDCHLLFSSYDRRDTQYIFLEWYRGMILSCGSLTDLLQKVTIKCCKDGDQTHYCFIMDNQDDNQVKREQHKVKPENKVSSPIKQCILLPPSSSPEVVTINFRSLGVNKILNCQLTDHLCLKRGSQAGYVAGLFVDDNFVNKKLPFNSVASQLAKVKIGGPAVLYDDNKDLSLNDLNRLLRMS